MKRGEVYWVQEDLKATGSEIKKRRPFVIVGANPLNKARRTVVAVPLSKSAPISPPVVVEVFALGQTVGAICDQIRAVDKGRFDKASQGALSQNDMATIDDSLKEVLDL